MSGRIHEDAIYKLYCWDSKKNTWLLTSHWEKNTWTEIIDLAILLYNNNNNIELSYQYKNPDDDFYTSCYYIIDIEQEIFNRVVF